MLKSKAIAIVSANTLQAIGLRELLVNYFSAFEVQLFQNATEIFNKKSTNNFAFIFLQADDYFAFSDELQNLKSTLIIFSSNAGKEEGNLPMLNILAKEEEIITSLEKIFKRFSKIISQENTEELSNRELDVLKLVSIGRMNKQIADQLNISLHTVISHRKNITRKLGIKTVSGLTVYALMNGIIGSENVE